MQTFLIPARALLAVMLLLSASLAEADTITFKSDTAFSTGAKVATVTTIGKRNYELRVGTGLKFSSGQPPAFTTTYLGGITPRNGAMLQTTSGSSTDSIGLQSGSATSTTKAFVARYVHTSCTCSGMMGGDTFTEPIAGAAGSGTGLNVFSQTGQVASGTTCTPNTGWNFMGTTQTVSHNWLGNFRGCAQAKTIYYVGMMSELWTTVQIHGIPFCDCGGGSPYIGFET